MQWLPASQGTWNGIITSYTIEYTLLHQVSTHEKFSDEQNYFMATKSQSQLKNNPDPTQAISPLMWEDIVIEQLKPYFVYSFSISYQNSAGKSDKTTLNISLPYSGK